MAFEVIWFPYNRGHKEIALVRVGGALLKRQVIIVLGSAAVESLALHGLGPSIVSVDADAVGHPL